MGFKQEQIEEKVEPLIQMGFSEADVIKALADDGQSFRQVQ